MKISKAQVIRFAITLVFFICMLYANFYALRKMARVGAELYLYDKLLVAFNIGGETGLEKEIDRIISEDKFPHELALAREFKNNHKSLADPAAFLRAKVSQADKRLAQLKSLRLTALVLIFIIFSWNLTAGLYRHFKQGRR